MRNQSSSRTWGQWAFGAAVASVCLGASLPRAWANDQRVLGYINHIPPESPEARTARHKKVTERRGRTPIMVHRGASAIAPENTLEAYNVAIDLGADGVEIDVHKSKDGVLYLMHDDTLDRMLNGSGKGKEKTYYEIVSLQYKNPKGPANQRTRVPTLAAFLELARRRAMLIHFDVKASGCQDDIIKMLDDADMWDQVVEVNAGNADKLRNHPKVKLLAYKGWFPSPTPEDNGKQFLATPGDMVFIQKDPTPAVKALGRKPGPAVPLPTDLRAEWTPAGEVTTRPTTAPASKTSASSSKADANAKAGKSESSSGAAKH